MTTRRLSYGTIAIDVTPLLPGGANGGAKIFVLTLLEELSALAPGTQFVLLTQHRTHDELAVLDRPNARRLMALGPAVSNVVRPGLKRHAGAILRRLPGGLRGLATRIGYRLDTSLKRAASRSIVHDVGADLLFCPFTAPYYHQPGVPTVCTIYDLQYKTHPDFFSAEIVAHRDRTFVEACRKAAALAPISEYSRRSVLQHAQIDPARVRAIPLRMAKRFVEPDEATTSAVLGRFGLVDGGYLIYPANFWPHKNHEMLLTAFGMARRMGLPSGCKLVLTGSPDERQAWLVSATKAFELSEHVVFPGFVTTDELAVLVGRARGMVFPSIYEGFGLPILEAMAAGVPVACSATTSLPEVAGDAALLFDPRVPAQIARSIVTLACDEGERGRLVAAGRERVREFSDPRRMAEEYCDLFESARSTSSAPSAVRA